MPKAEKIARRRRSVAKVRVLLPKTARKKRAQPTVVWPSVVVWSDDVFSVICRRCGRQSLYGRSELTRDDRCSRCKTRTLSWQDLDRRGWWAFNVSWAGDDFRIVGSKGPYSDPATAIIGYSVDLGWVSFGPVASA